MAIWEDWGWRPITMPEESASVSMNDIRRRVDEIIRALSHLATSREFDRDLIKRLTPNSDPDARDLMFDPQNDIVWGRLFRIPKLDRYLIRDQDSEKPRESERASITKHMLNAMRHSLCKMEIIDKNSEWYDDRISFKTRHDDTWYQFLDDVYFAVTGTRHRVPLYVRSSASLTSGGDETRVDVLQRDWSVAAYEETGLEAAAQPTGHSQPLLYFPEQREAERYGLGAELRLIKEYRLSDRNQIPFGGRKAELQRLNDWLANDVEPSHLLLTALSGQGKTALVIDWRNSLLSGNVPSEQQWNIVFVPISLRVDTHRPEVYWRSMADQLCELAPLRLTADERRDAVSLKEAVRRRLDALSERSTRVLLIIDGLDETLHGDFDASVLPAPSRNIRALFSARLQAGDANGNGWKNRIWGVRPGHIELMKLEPLVRDDIEQILLNLSPDQNPLIGDKDLPTRLDQLTKGDAVLLHLYLTEIAGRAYLTLQSLPAAPGFEGFFVKWRNQQDQLWRDEGLRFSEDDINKALSIFAFALGPLTSSDFLDLLEFIQSWKLVSEEPLLRALRRFVWGDGNEGSGYVLSHPKLAEYFQKILFKGRSKEIKGAFLAWGQKHLRRVNKNPGQDAPVYALQFLSSHLRDAGSPPVEWMEFVEDGWRQAWLSFEGGTHGFATDVQKAWDVVRPEGVLAHRVGAEWRCALVMSSIESVSWKVDHQILFLAIADGILPLSDVLSIAKNRPDAIESLSIIARLIKCGIITQNDAIYIKIPEIYRIIHRIYRERTKNTSLDLFLDLLDDLLPTESGQALSNSMNSQRQGPSQEVSQESFLDLLPEIRRVVMKFAFEGVRAHVSPSYRAHALTRLVRHLLPQMRGAVVDEARRNAMAVEDEAERAELLADMSQYLSLDIRNTILDDALAPLIMLRDPWLCAHQLTKVIQHLPPGKRETIVGQALAAAKAIRDKESRDDMLARLVGYLSPEVRDTLVDELFESVRVASDPELRLYVLTQLAQHLSPDILGTAVDEILKAVKLIDDPHTHVDALARLVPHISSEMRGMVIETALTSIRKIEDPSKRAWEFARIIQQLSPEARGTVIKEALTSSRVVADPWMHANALVSLISHLAPNVKGRVTEEALAFVMLIEDPWERVIPLARLFQHLSPDVRDALMPEVLTFARMFGEPGIPNDALEVLIEHLPPDIRRTVVKEAVSAASAIEYPRERAAKLVRLVYHVEPGMRYAVAEEALAAARVIESPAERADVLARLVQHLAPEMQGTVMGEILTSVRAIAGRGWRAVVLARLIQHLAPEMRGIKEALKTTLKVKDPKQRAESLAHLIPLLSPQMRSAATEEVLFVVRTMADSTLRAELLDMIIEHLPSDVKREIFQEMLLSIEMSIEDRARMMPKLVNSITAAERSYFLDVLMDMAAKRPRSEVLGMTSAAIDSIKTWGGEKGIYEVARAIIDTKKWYP